VRVIKETGAATEAETAAVLAYLALIEYQGPYPVGVKIDGVNYIVRDK
jgi:hypothetical protein